MSVIYGHFVMIYGGLVVWWLDRRLATFPGPSHDVQSMGDLLVVNRTLYVSQHGPLSHLSSLGR